MIGQDRSESKERNKEQETQSLRILIMPVTYLELENFKSYSGIQKIGPFTDFTCVVGPNGAGKSNLMDAISFVFGVQSRDLRSSQLKDLIFRPPGKSSTGRLRARASLYFQSDDDEEEEICFSRTISPAGVGDYQVNGRSKSFKEYEQALADIGVLLKARNFLVFQGDVESIAHKSPKELVLMLEQISTSADLKEEYDDLALKKEQAEAATVFMYNKQKGFKSERRLLKDQKEEAERFHALLEKKNKVQSDLYLWQLFHINESLQEKEEVLAELHQEVESLESDETETQAALKKSKKTASAARRETTNADKKRVELSASLHQLEPAVMDAQAQVKNLEKRITADEKLLQKHTKAAANHKTTLEELKTEIKSYEETQQALETEYQELKENSSEVTLTKEQEEEYERVKELAAASSDVPRRALATMNRKLEASRSKTNELSCLLQDLTARKETTEKKVQEQAQRKEDLTKVRCLHLSYHVMPIHGLNLTRYSRSTGIGKNLQGFAQLRERTTNYRKVRSRFSETSRRFGRRN